MKNVLITTLGATLIVVLAGVLTPTQAQSGDNTAIKTTFFGCAKFEDWKAFRRLFKDPPAADEFATEHCQVLPAGTPVSIEDRSIMENAVCARPQGRPTCYWILRAFVAEP